MIDRRHYECAACRFSQPISDEGVDRMREHIKTHARDPKKIRDKAYVVARGYR